MTLQQLFDLSSSDKITLRDEILFQLLTNSATPLTPSEAVLSSSLENASGNTGGSTLAVTFTTSDDFAGSINGIARDAGTSYVFNPTTGYLNPLISYIITAGTIKIDKYTLPV